MYPLGNYQIKPKAAYAMTCEADFIIPDELLTQIADQGLDVLLKLIHTVINTAMQIERQQFLNAGQFESLPERRVHR